MRRVRPVLIDDLTDAEVDELGTYELPAPDGIRYEIDLSPASVERLRDALAPFVAKARRAMGNGKARGSKATTTTDRGTTTKDERPAIRAFWERNHDVAAFPRPAVRGRIPGDVVTAYRERGGQDYPRPAAEPEPATAPRKRAAKSTNTRAKDTSA